MFGKSQLLLLGVVGGVGYLIYKAMAKADAGYNLDYGVKRINYKGSDLLTSNFDFDLKINNSRDESLFFNSFYGTLSYQGSKVADIALDGAGKFITIPAQGNAVVTVPVTIDNLNTLAAAVDLVKKILSRTPVTGLLLDGTISLGPFNIPISQNLSFLFGQNNTTVPAMTGTHCACRVSGVLN